MTGRRLSLSVVALVAAALTTTTASASVAAPGEPTGLTPEMSAACLDTLKAPRLLAPSPVALPDVVWDKRSIVRALVSFRLDATGHPTNVLATVADLDKDAKPLFERAIVEAFMRYAFCPAGDFSTTLSWTGRLVFSPATTLGVAEGASLYLQSFVPDYFGYGRFEKHASGRAVVRGTYGTDGRTRSVQVVVSSGDKILDDKSRDAMASAQVLFRNGVAPSKPISIERPFTYQP